MKSNDFETSFENFPMYDFLVKNPDFYYEKKKLKKKHISSKIKLEIWINWFLLRKLKSIKIRKKKIQKSKKWNHKLTKSKKNGNKKQNIQTSFSQKIYSNERIHNFKLSIKSISEKLGYLIWEIIGAIEKVQHEQTDKESVIFTKTFFLTWSLKFIFWDIFNTKLNK